MRHRDGTLAIVAGYQLPNRELRRDLFEHEVAAQVDFATMEDTYERERASLVADYKRAQIGQIDEVAAAVEAAAGNAVALAQITVQPVPASIVEPHLADSALAGWRSARQEFVAQTGGEPAAVDQAALDSFVAERALAVCLTLANGLSTAASKRASATAGLEGEAAANAVRTYLLELSDAELELQLGGAVMQAYNAGRREFMRAQEAPPETPSVMAIEARAEPELGRPGGPGMQGVKPLPYRLEIYASEVMDANTCEECAEIDGKEYATLPEAEEDYPVGGYVDCEGGLRCRGTLVAVYTPSEPVEPATAVPSGEPSGVLKLPSQDATAALDTFETEMQRRIDSAAHIPSPVARQEIVETGEEGMRAAAEAREAIRQLDDLVRFPAPTNVSELRNGGMFDEGIMGYGPLGGESSWLGELFFNPSKMLSTRFGSGGWRASSTHELGHRLDNLIALDFYGGAPPDAYWTHLGIASSDPTFRALWTAMQDSGPISYLLEMLKGEAPQVFSPYRIRYLLTPTEQFARAFSQFVAVEMGDDVAKRFLQESMGKIGTPNPSLMQWTDRDFEPIRVAMREWLEAKGLLK